MFMYGSWQGANDFYGILELLLAISTFQLSNNALMRSARDKRLLIERQRH